METKEIKIKYVEFTGSNFGEVFLLLEMTPAYAVLKDDHDRTYIINRDSLNEFEIIDGDYIVVFPSGYVESFRGEMFRAMFGDNRYKPESFENIFKKTFGR